jgi:ABC-type multidrug transport system fused ATPase/permease subunit
LDLETKSPLYSHFIETLSGLSTIRAFGWQTQSESRNIGLLNSSTRPYLTLLCAQAWLKLVLDLTVAGIAVLTIGTAVALRGVISAGFVGVALVNVMMFSTTISLFISSWTGLEMSLGAILRIKTFEEETPSEDRDGEDFKPPHDWPSQGAVELRHVSASYGYAISISFGMYQYDAKLFSILK